jgi:hypothetical protein
MRSKRLRPSLAAFMLTLCAAGAYAQDARVQALERNLQERDKVITELLERVEALERRLGIRRSATDAASRLGQDVVPGGEGHLAETSERAPGAIVVEEGAAERALERSLTREGALLLPPGVLEVEPSFTYARREDAAPRFVTSAGVVFAGETRRSSSSLTADLALRLGLPRDAQLEIGFPYRWREIESATRVGFTPTDSSRQSGAGPGDVRIGLAKTLLREGPGRPDLVGRLLWDTDSGKARDNEVALGGGFHELRGSLTAIKRQDPVAFIAGLSYQHAFENDGLRPGRTLSANLGSFIALSPETSLRLVLSGAHQKESEFLGGSIGGSDQTVVTFVVGGSTLLARGTLLNLSAGIGLTDDADDFSITLSLPIRLRGM